MIIPKTLGRYKIIKKLGHGGMGLVLLGKDPKIDRSVGLKVISLEDILNPQKKQILKERFLVEAKAAGKLTHPNIVTIYDVGEEEGMSFMTMEYVEGKDLSHILADDGALSFRRAVKIVTQVAEGLAFAHAKGIVHRDIKPGNILLYDDDKVKITDFGIAKFQSSVRMTRTGHMIGTPGYSSPEQVQSLPVTGQSDIFSLGAMFYEMLTGRAPFESESVSAIILKIMEEDPVPARQINSHIPPPLEEILNKMLAKKPGDRYKSCQDLVNDLKNFEIKDVSAPAQVGDANIMNSQEIETPVGVYSDSTLPMLGKPGKKKAVVLKSMFLCVLLLILGVLVWSEPEFKPYLPINEAKKLFNGIIAESLDKKEPGAIATVDSNGALKPKNELKTGPVIKEIKKPWINIDSQVEAEIFVDGDSVGRTPIKKLLLSSGKHKIEARAQRYQPWEITIFAEPGNEESISARLKPLLASLKLTTNPENADVNLDGKPVGQTPLEIPGLTLGVHKLSISKMGFDLVEKEVNLKKSELNLGSIKLEAITGLIKVVSPEKAKVFLDGKVIGKGALTIRRKPGTYNIRIEMKGYAPHKSKVTVLGGKETEITARLRPMGYGSLIVSALPWAVVYLNGNEMGTTPKVIEKVKTGKVAIGLVNPKFKPFTKTITLEKGQTRKIIHTFKESEALSIIETDLQVKDQTPQNKAKEGVLKVFSNPQGTVFINGKPYGGTPLIAKDLALGGHEVMVKREGFPDYKRRVSLSRGVVTRIVIGP